MKLNINSIIENTKVEGPGNRTCIFVQGCLQHCYKCSSPQTWDLNVAKEYDVDSLAQMILKNTSIDGVTFSGGEPFLQAKSLYQLAKILQSEGLSIVTFTGYDYNLIKKINSAYWNKLLDITDILISGKFIYENRCTDKLWVGSSNQQVHFLSDRYRDFQKSMEDKKNKIEIRLNNDGSIIVNGMADNKKILDLFKEL